MEKQNGSAKLAKQKEIIKKVYEAFETGKTSDLDKYITSDVKEHNPDPSVKSTGIQYTKDQVSMYYTAFPDMKIQIDEVFGDGDKLAIATTFTGTNKGSLMGNPPTNKKVTSKGIEFVQFKDEKITDHWGVYDSLGMFQQLGIIPTFDKLVKQEVH
jgi:steroid delta-isomerase-like uncharacterized protein